ncbi:aminopeptidase N-like [Leptidea sinapis]|uniref:aminopeptidase N-like n=1 Tax=Leptidea sinapis TaxID=189913 RepID=UPI002137708D|nr:aminopeptidase N-like [Leptidea sinapis]
MGVHNIICVLLAIVVSITSLPLRTQIETVTELSDSLKVIHLEETINNKPDDNKSKLHSDLQHEENHNISDEILVSRNLQRNNIRPGMTIFSNEITLTPDLNAGTFTGVAEIDVRLSSDTSEDEVVFSFDGLNVDSILQSVGGGTTYEQPAGFDTEDGLLTIFTGRNSVRFNFIINYSGSLDSWGNGLYRGNYGTDTYLAMNLHPTNARRVFPCFDDITVPANTFSLNVAGLNYQNMASNTAVQSVEDGVTKFTPMINSFPYLWGLVAHNMNAVSIQFQNVIFYVRQGVMNQDALSSSAINSFFSTLTEWTKKPYEEIFNGQEERLHILAVPDVDRDWYALSTISIWEPYVLMELGSPASQRKTGLMKLAQALARRWFGYVLMPESWNSQWVISGLGTTAAFEAFRIFQTDPSGADVTLLDADAIFLSDIIQESLYMDGYPTINPILTSEEDFEEDWVRSHVNGPLRFKAPAIIRMLQLTMSTTTDYIQQSAAQMLSTNSLEIVSSSAFYSALEGAYGQEPNRLIGDIADFLSPWIENSHYPMVRVTIDRTIISLSQVRFSFAAVSDIAYPIPITYTTSINPNFDNLRPELIMENSHQIINPGLSTEEGEEDWIIFNIQGQGYYRVNYPTEMWEVFAQVLADPERRAAIHPLNRATLIDDALNLARGGHIGYEVAMPIVLGMELETEYVVWKAFVRNMEFLKRFLLALVEEDEDLDPDIYLRMIRRTVVGLEQELTFTPELNVNEPAMTSLVRGLVMDHACRSNYDPCIAAAVDWFRDPNDNTIVNPNIPADLRPAVYCTSVMIGGEEERELLFNRLSLITNGYERLVILESLACSQDTGFILTYLQETLGDTYFVEERSRIFKAVVQSSRQNLATALQFISINTNNIRQAYGGSDKLEDIIAVLAGNIPDEDLTRNFVEWVNNRNNELDDSILSAERARDRVIQDNIWRMTNLQDLYEWIDENDAPTLMISMFLISVSLFIALFNH